jgi:phosphoglycerate kinase
MDKEVTNIAKVLHDINRPFCAIIGGAKVSDKITLIENLMDKADTIIIGGGMAFTFIKAQNGQIGDSLCEIDKLDLASDILKKAVEKEVKFLLPVDAKNHTRI